MLEDGLVALLAADDDVSALVAARIYPLVMPPDPTRDMYPALVYQMISGEGLYSMEGVNKFQYARVQVDCLALVYGDAKNLAKAVKARLEGYNGTLPDNDKTRVDMVVRNVEMDAFDDAPFTYRTVLDFTFSYAIA